MTRVAAAIPPAPGVGFKPEHAAGLADEAGPVAWLEVHAETYMVAGGPRLALLEALRRDFPLSLHGVGLSLAGGAPLDPDHLARLRALVDRFEPGLVSEHLAWSRHDGRHLPDLLPIPFGPAALADAVAAVDAAQTALRRRILVENPSQYLALPGDEMPEAEFLAELVRRTGCGLLADVTNMVVAAANLGRPPELVADALPAAAIGEIHLAGHAVDPNDGDPLLIDDHGSAVSAAVWALAARLLARVGPRPLLVEWDTDVPDWPTLRAEAAQAQALLDARAPAAAA